MIISDKLSQEESLCLLTVLEKHHSAFGYSLQDLKGISPALCTHHIPIDPDSIPSREPQHRLNNAMREIVKKEVLKLLHVGIIYPIPYSEWVSPVQVVPKKFIMTNIGLCNTTNPTPLAFLWLRTRNIHTKIKSLGPSHKTCT